MTSGTPTPFPAIRVGEEGAAVSVSAVRVVTKALRVTSGVFCRIGVIRGVLDCGYPVEILYEVGAWKRVHAIVPEIVNEPRPTDGTQYVMVDGGDTACRVHPGESIMCRIPKSEKN